MIYNKNSSKFGALWRDIQTFAGSPLEGFLFQLSLKHSGAGFYEMGSFPLPMYPLRKFIVYDEDITIQILIELLGKDDEY